jgi:hypothetical protein
MIHAAQRERAREAVNEPVRVEPRTAQINLQRG